MKSLMLDSSGDLVFKDGDLMIVEATEELMQTIRTLLHTNINEWFLNPEQGLDYSVIFTKEVDEESISFAIQDALDQLDEIDRFEDFSTNFNAEKRTLEIFFTVITVDGEVLEISEVI